MRWLAGLLLSIGTTGCFSFIGVRSAPPPCTDNWFLPGVDVVLAAAGAAIIAVTVTTNRERTLLMNPLTGGLLAVPDTISALYGFKRVSGCRAAKARASRTTPASASWASTPGVVP